METVICNQPREKTLGGSEAAAVLGLNEYESKFDLFAHKHGLVKRSFNDNRFIEWGHRSEPMVADKYSDDHDVKLIESPKKMRKERPWMSGTPDRLIIARPNHPDTQALGTVYDYISKQTLLRRGLEIKTGQAKHTNRWGKSRVVINGYGKAESHPVPLYYWTQCQWYMHIMDFPEWDLVVKLGSADYREYRLLRDEKWLSSSIEICERFWNDHIVTKNAPPLDWGSSCRSYLVGLYPEHGDVVRDATPVETSLAETLREIDDDIRGRIARRKQLEGEIKERERELYDLIPELNKKRREEEEVKSLLRTRIGRDEGIRLPDGSTIKWKQQRTKTGSFTRIFRKTWKSKPLPLNTRPLSA